MVYEHFDGPLVPVVSALSWTLLIGLASFFLVYKTKFFDQLLSTPLVPPFLALPAIMFAFLMGFMSADSWQNFAYARTAMINEASAISRLANIPILPPEFQAKSNVYLQSYLEASLKEEWAGTHNEVVSPKARESLDNLGSTIWSADRYCMDTKKVNDCTSAAAISAFTKAVDDLRLAREQRLSLGYQSSRNAKWLLVILLGFISALSVAAVHRHNQKTGVIASVLFCISLWIAFSMIALYINPYKWSESVKPVPMQTLLEAMKNPQK
jgi:hypothetical protein